MLIRTIKTLKKKLTKIEMATYGNFRLKCKKNAYSININLLFQ